MILIRQVRSSLTWLFRGINKPLFLIQWAKIHAEIIGLQIYYLFQAPEPKWSLLSYLKMQYIIGDLLWNLELHHRMEVSLHWSGKLPHVDTGYQEKKKKARLEVINSPKMVDLVFVGAGHAHAYVLKKFGMEPMEGVRVTVITDKGDTPYSGMLPGEVAGDYTREESHVDVRNLCAFAGAVFVQAFATHIDRKNRLIHVDTGGPPIHYDVLSIDIGSSPKLLPESQTKDTTIDIIRVKPISNFSQKYRDFLDKLREATKTVTIGVVGGGASGVDLIIGFQKRFEKMGKKTNLVLFSAVDTVVPTHNKLGQKLLLEGLKEKNITVKKNYLVKSIEGNAVVSTTGERVKVDELFWCTNATCSPLLRESGFTCNKEGFINVKTTLQTYDSPNVFAAGDCCNVVDDPCPKAGVFAVREGPIIAQNVAKRIEYLQYGQESKLVPYVPQRTFLGIIGKEDVCIATKGAMAIRGEWLWDLKQWIDITWMKDYNVLPEMEGEKKGASDMEALIEKSKMRCGGCGSKVGATALTNALQRIGLPTENLDDCSILATPPEGKKLVQTVDFFRAMVNEPYTFGKICAVHALSDVHAMGGKGLSAQAVCVVPFATSRITEDTLVQLLSGSLDILKQEQCELQGGHSTEGDVLSMGLSITGLCDSDKILKKSGAKPGDKLIITKPLGTGVLLAAQMRQKAKCWWIDGAVNSMVKSNLNAGQVLKNYATSCTDVTGFGLAGHLAEVLKASGVQAKLNLHNIPLIPGASDASDLGIESSLFEENFKAAEIIHNVGAYKENHEFKLLFDPQTAGGLLATVPAAKANEAVQKLKAEGYGETAIIGEIVTGSSKDGNLLTLSLK